MRLLRIAAGIGLLIALPLLAAWQVPRFLDWDRYRVTVERVASAGIGRPVRITGAIRLSLLPEAILRAGDVTIADTGDGAGATVAELRIRVGLRALLTGRVELQDVVLQGARMRLPWPLAGFTLPGTPPPAGLHARVEDGTLLLGGLPVTGISGDLSAGGPDTALSAAGLATVLGRPWRMTGRLGQAGADGSATVAVSLDGQDAGVGTGGALTGQMAADGGVSGRITGRGPDLSLLLPAPRQPWLADGRLVAGSGLIVADDLELTIGGSPARGAVALRLLPQLRLDAALATNRLDLDAWLPPLLQGGAVALPTGIDLSAETAPLAGGTLRGLRAGFELAGGRVSLRESQVRLPGDATLQLSGVLSGSRFDGGARLTAPDLAQTLAWLRPRAPGLMDALPLATLHAASLAATVQAGGDGVAFAGIQGDVDGVPLTGTLALHAGARPAVAADLRLVGPVLDRWLPDLPGDMAQASAQVAAAARWAAAFDGNVSLTAARPVWHGTVFDRAVVDGSARGGTVELRHAAITGPGVSAALSGSLDGTLRIGDGKLAVQLDDAGPLAGRLPPGGQFARPLFRGPVSLDLAATGPSGAWVTQARVDLADARLRAEGRWNLAGRRWAGSVLLHHPGAPRLLASLGLAGMAGWLGDGSLSVQTAVAAEADRVALDGFTLSAGGLRGRGTLTLAWPETGVPMLTGALDMDALPVPLPYLRSTNPLDFDVLRAGDADVAVRTAQLLWGGSDQGEAASARAVVTAGVLHLDDIVAHLAGGALTGALTLEAAGTPRLHAIGRLAGAVLTGPVFGTALDVTAGRLDATADVSTAGYSPSALFAGLCGPVRATVTDGVLTGLDAGLLLGRLQGLPASAASGPDSASLRAGVVDSLSHGTTPFATLDVPGTAASGLLTLAGGSLSGPAGTAEATGTIDLPASTVDLELALQPRLDGSPTVGLRLIGPAMHPSRNASLAELTRWLAAH